MVELLESARRFSARAVNSIMTATYWEIGRRIVELEQGGEKRAEYGEVVVKQLAVDLTKRFGRGFSWRNLYQMRSFFEAYPDILQTPSAKSQDSMTEQLAVLPSLSACFPLPWSHYVRLLTIDDGNARRFYEHEALRGGWSVRQLKRQIDSQFYERTLLSKNKAAMLRKGEEPLSGDLVTPEEQIKDPLVLEFLDLKDEYSEYDLEDALVPSWKSFCWNLEATSHSSVGRSGCESVMNGIASTCCFFIAGCMKTYSLAPIQHSAGPTSMERSRFRFGRSSRTAVSHWRGFCRCVQGRNARFKE